MTQRQLSIPQEPHIFKFGEIELRAIAKDGEIWFIAKDVAEALKYPKSSTRQMVNLISHVPDMWKGLNPIKVRSKSNIEQVREIHCLSEQGLYFFLGRSDKPNALSYQIWVAGEVIPAIRKTGSYSTGKKPLQLDALSTVADRKPISNLVSIWVGCAPITFKEAWGMVHAHFNIKSVEELNVSQIEPVVEWIQERIDTASRPVIAWNVERKNCAECAKTAPNFDTILEQLRDSRSASNAELKAAYQDYEAAGGKDAIGGWDIIYNMRKLYENVFNLAIATPLALDSLNRMEAELYRTAAVRLKMQRLLR